MTKKIMISFRIETERLNQAKALATLRDQNVSELIRTLISEEILENNISENQIEKLLGERQDD